MNKTVMENLDTKISLILERYSWIKKENTSIKEESSKLKSELTELRATLESKEKEILMLKENEELKDLELEEMAERIEKAVKVDETTVVENQKHAA